MFKKLFSFFAALTLSVGLWAAAPAVGDVFTDNVSGLNFEVTSLDPKTVKVFPSNETGTACEVPATVSYKDVTFAVTEIGESAFQAWNFLQSITLPESVTTIGEMAFYSCISLQSVSIDGVQTIGTQAFYSCGSLQSIVWSNVTTIENSAFDGCGFTSLTFPATLTTIGAEAFVGCNSLQAVTFSGNCAIEEDAFIGVGGDPYVLLTLPDNWTGTKPDEDGNWCGGLFELYEAPATPKVGDQFVDEASGLKFEVTSLDPKAVKVIANSYEGTSYNVPATVSYLDETFAITEIGEKAFYECTSLKSITFPASIQQIGEEAFAECNQLRSITCKASLPPECPTSAFWSGVIRDMPLYVPAFSVEAYQESEPWGSLFVIRALPLEVGDQFVDATSGLKFEVTAVDPKTVKVIANNYSNTSYNVPATASYLDETFAVTEIGEKAFFGCTALQSVTFLGNACQNAIGEDAFSGVGNPDPALLTLPDNWTGTIPDEDGNWYGGKFELSSIPGLTTYLDENGEKQEIVAAEVENASENVTWGTADQTTWFVVKGTNVQLSAGAICAGDVRLILADGAKLTATGDSYDWTPGIEVSGEGNSLTIYAQSTGEQSGQLIATSESQGAGIGGGMYGDGSNITINGGVVTATGGEMAAGIGGGVYGDGSNITINGGEVTATGRDGGAGIGGGNDGLGSNITINGGTITATSAQQGAGIGGGVFAGGSNITINGGEVTATGGEMAAGIGGGEEANGSNITINGGTVTANGGDDAAGIGGGARGGSGSNITINGGVVTATGGDEAAGIGGGSEANGSNITINGGTVTATSKYGAGIGGGSDGSGSNITINGGTITATGKYGAGIGGGNEYEGDVASNIYISDAYVLKAGSAANPTDIIAHSSATDLASTLTQPYVKIEGLATPYTRIVTANSWGTVCLPYAATDFSGVTFYKVNYYNASENALYLEEVSALEAGKPYIFEATEDGTLTINHSATAPMAYSEAGNEGGLYGSFARTTLAYDADHAYAAISGGAVNVVESGYTVTVPACRAYLDMDEVATSVQPHNAPLRCMGAPRGQATDLETIDNAQCTMHNGKFLRNGQFIIVREGKMFNAQGMEVK